MPIVDGRLAGKVGKLGDEGKLDRWAGDENLEQHLETGGGKVFIVCEGVRDAQASHDDVGDVINDTGIARQLEAQLANVTAIRAAALPHSHRICGVVTRQAPVARSCW